MMVVHNNLEGHYGVLTNFVLSHSLQKGTEEKQEDLVLP